MLDVIAFDADDTLWHTEPYYRETERSFLAMLSRYGVAPNQALEAFHQIEIDNLAFFGYGIRGFTLSLIEAAIRLTGGGVSGAEIHTLLELGRGMTTHPIRLLEGVEQALAGLNGKRLILITKGDALDQESKIRRSGLAGYFPAVEILVDKNPEAYATLLAKYTINPGRFMMVGNSLRSDIAPVLALGGYAVHVPYPGGWAHESIADLPEDRSRFFEIDSLRELPGVVERIEAGEAPL